jgi:hypothetical protein
MGNKNILGKLSGLELSVWVLFTSNSMVVGWSEMTFFPDN